MSSITTVSVNGLKTVMAASITSGVRLGVQGTFGIGKSAIAEQVARDAKCKKYPNGRPFRSVVATQLDPSDTRGLPIIVDRESETPRTAFTKSDLLNCEPGTVLLIDEIADAEQLVQGQLYQLMHEGRLGDHKLPEDVCILAAWNRPEDSALSGEIPAPLANRMMIVDFDGPTAKEWVNYAVGKKLDPRVVAHINKSGSAALGIGQRGPAQGNMDLRVPTPRSWENVSKVLDANPNMKPQERLVAIASLVGQESAGHFETVLQLADRLPDWDDIKKDPAGATIPDDTDMAAQFYTATMVARHAADHPKEALEYIGRTGEDQAAVMLSQALTGTDQAQAAKLTDYILANMDEHEKLMENVTTFLNSTH